MQDKTSRDKLSWSCIQWKWGAILRKSVYMKESDLI